MILRSKIQYYEQGERSYKFFSNLERKNSSRKVISRLNVKGQIIENQNQILGEMRKFYKDLCSSRNCNVDTSPFFLNDQNIKQLKEQNKILCEKPIVESEAKLVIKNMKNGKTPGSDGYLVEFYKFFWNDIGDFLLRSFNEGFSKGELSVTQRHGILTCIPKGQKSREFISNFRPITLLNVDYKILSGILAARMRKVLPDIISDSQKGFLKERYIGENSRLVYDVMSRLNQLDRKGLILLADFEKAFDSIEWYYINKVLVAYNFGTNFIKWFQILYNSACTSVINNGYLSESFFLHQGCRQGDPLSPYIFILAIEPLAMAIKSNVRIKGIKIDGNQYKLGLYADDTFLLLDGSQMSLRESIKVFDNFFSCSGLKLNREKTELAWLGINNGKAICKDLNLKWVTSFKLLGINFLLDLDNMIQSNYQPVINKIENIISIYKARNLSLIGKIAVLKMIVVSKLVYTLSVLPLPTSNMFHHLEKLFRSFIWSNKTPKISMTELYKRVSKGGLRLTNLKCFNNALKLSWIKRLLIKDQQWQSLFEKNCGFKQA